MKRSARWLVRLYPSAWRARYGEELEELIAAEGMRPLRMADVVRAALIERVFDRSGLRATSAPAVPGKFTVLIRAPSGFLPLTMSVLALLVVGISVALFGTGRSPDEGTAAHLFQLLIACQLPTIAWFAWNHRKWRDRWWLALSAIQLSAIVIALLPVWYLGL